MNEYILYNAKIWTADRDKEWADAMWISDDKILAVGSFTDIDSAASVHVKRKDMKGQTIVPGFVDCHVHITTVAKSSWQYIMDKDKYTCVEELFEDIAAYAKEHPIEEVPHIYATPCPQEWMKGLDRTMLDRYVSDRPVLLCDEGFHSCLLNSKMLELMEIDENTPYNYESSMNYARDEHNVPTGIAYEHCYEFDLPKMYEKIGWYPPDQSDPSVIGPVVDTFAKYGVTAVMDGFTEGDETYEGLKKLEAAGKLPMYYQGNSLFKSLDDLDEGIANALTWRAKYSDHFMDTHCVKLFLDGTNELGTSALMEAMITDSDNYGTINMEEDDLVTALLKINAHHLDIQIHMVGDRAFHVAVNAVEKAQAAAKESGIAFTTRVELLHCELTKPADRKRAANLGIYINCTPHWNGGIFGDEALKLLGQERFDTFYSFNDFIKYKASLSCSSDIVSMEEIERANPFVAMQIGANRQDPLSCFEKRQPESECLSVRDMMFGYTIEGAKCMGMEDSIGSLEKGKMANYLVLNQNVFETSIDQLSTTQVENLIFEGNVIF